MTTPTSLQDLPIDALTSIFDFLPQKDIKQLRLTCRALASAAKLNFKRVFLSPNRTNIDVFNQIIRHENYRHQVKEIIWDDTRLEGDDLPEDNEEEIPAPGPPDTFVEFEVENHIPERFIRRERYAARLSEIGGPKVKQFPLTEHINLRKQLYEEQQRIIRNGEDAEALHAALLLPNLQRVTITSAAWRTSHLFPRFETPFCRLRPSEFLVATIWPWFGSSTRPKERRLLRKPWDVTKNEWRGYNVVSSALRELSSRSNVTELVMDTNLEPTGIGHQLFNDPNSLGYCQTLDLFAAIPLKRLDLAINTKTAELDGFSCFRNGLLKHALSKLTSLTSFSLHTSYDISTDQAREGWAISLHDVLPSHIWASQLKSLTLSSLFVTADSLFELLSEYDLLHTITLDSIMLEGASWRSTLHRFRDEFVDKRSIWRKERTNIAFRCHRYETRRMVLTNEVQDFLFDGAECPLEEDYPWWISKGVGYMVDDIDKEYIWNN